MYHHEKLLTEKQERFCLEYIVDLNATQAAIRAGYRQKTAYSQGQRMLKNVEIQRRIRELNEERFRRVQIQADDVIQELARIAFSNMGNYAHWGPDGVVILPIERLTPGQLAAVAEITETITEAGGNKRIKLHDKLKALELLGKHLNLFERNAERERYTAEDIQALLKKFTDQGYRPRNPIIKIDDYPQNTLPEKSETNL